MAGSRRYEQRARAESAEETRQRILEALEQQIRDHPAQPVSIDQVARRAGVARSTVYLIFGSRAGLFDALGDHLWQRAGFQQVVDAVGDPDAQVTLRRGIGVGVQMFAQLRDVGRALFSMAAIDADAVGGAIARMEENRSGGMDYLAGRLAEQGLLRPDVTQRQAADLLWLLTSFDAADLLYTGRGRSPAEITDLLVSTAERALLR